MTNRTWIYSNIRVNSKYKVLEAEFESENPKNIPLFVPESDRFHMALRE